MSHKGTWESIESPFSAISPFPWWIDMIITICLVIAVAIVVAVFLV